MFFLSPFFGLPRRIFALVLFIMRVGLIGIHLDAHIPTLLHMKALRQRYVYSPVVTLQIKI